MVGRLTLLALVFLVGCSWSQQTRERTTEVNKISGSVAGAPVELVHQRQTDRSEDVEGTRNDGLTDTLIQGVGTALTGGSSLATGGGIGLAVGLLGMGWTWLQKRKTERQRDEIIEGVEASKRSLENVKLRDDHTAWDELTGTLERKQSRDTIEHIQRRTP
jgi:hypothetical protein